MLSLLTRGGPCPCCAYAGAGGFSLDLPEPMAFNPFASSSRRAARAGGSAATQIGFERAPELHLRGVTVVDPRDGSKAADMTVVTRDGRIAAVVPGRRSHAAPGAQVVEAAGHYVVPGYNDMHSHVLELKDPSGSLALMLSEGVTGFRQMSGSPALLARRRAGRLPIGRDAPQLLQTPGSILTPFNAGSTEAVRAEVRRQKAQGADFIKMGMTNPDVFFAALDEGRSVGVPVLGHLQEGTDAREASARGFRCIEHLGPGSTVWVCCSDEEAELRADSYRREVIKAPPVKVPFLEALVMKRLQVMLVNPSAFARPADVERLRRATESFNVDKAHELAEDFKADGSWQCPTLVRLRTQQYADAPEYERDEMLEYLPPKSVRRWREVTARWKALPEESRRVFREIYPRQLALAKLLHDVGVRMIVGTDGGSFLGPGLTLKQEFAELAAAGLPSLAVLQMATVNAAAYLGRTATMGAVEVGRDADMVVLDADPLDRVENLHAIAGVVRAGRHHSRADLDALKSDVANKRSRA